MNNNEEKDFHKKKKAEKESAKNLTKYLIYDKLFILKFSNKNHDGENFIKYSSATSRMVNSE